MKKLLYVLISCVLLASCAIHQGNVGITPIDKKVTYKREAIGVSSTTNVLGIGGLSHDGLVWEAKQAMMKNSRLKSDEILLNYTVDIKKSFYFLVFKTKVTVTADVASVNDGSAGITYSNDYLSGQKSIQTSPKGLFEVGDSIVFDYKKKGTVISFPTENAVKIMYYKNGKPRTKCLSLAKIFTTKKNFNNCNIGNDFIVTKEEKHKTEAQVWQVFALGESHVLLNNGKTLKAQNINDVFYNYRRKS